MHVEDRRVRRTRERLQEALVALVLEKSYQKVTVQDILDRADVGRSTFYTHYQSKDDLLLSGYDDVRVAFLAEAQRVPDDILGPMRALFHSVKKQRALYEAMVLGHELAIRPIRDQLNTILFEHLRPRLTVSDEELSAIVVFLFSGMNGLITWWMVTKARCSADEMYERFRRLALPGLAAL
ncbi:TetR/AcrR family transcriptional regulator [Actinocrispum sp. NPDC049592]|uniref:TetR/AcrR family transcriptional regulator n=1 Tax=Actinocrispum sp. NPDC049592 TaxID=3154835 RepID=UPI0034431912